MVSIFTTINDSVYKQTRAPRRKCSVEAISQPISKKECTDESHFIGRYTPASGPLKFYIVQNAYSSTRSKHISVKRGTLVQLVSHEEDGLCLIKLVREVGTGLIPYQCLQEHSTLNGSLPSNRASVPKVNQFIDLTPPTSPSTLKSYVFTPASQSRGSSLSVTSSTSTVVPQETPKQEGTNFCTILSVDMKDGRVQYKLNVEMSSGRERVSYRYYNDFYKLHSTLLGKVPTTANYRLPNLPLPVNLVDKEVEESIITERIEMFNNYLAKLKEVVTINNDTADLRSTIQDWFKESEDMIPVKVKVLIKGDYYVMKCNYGDISTYQKLQLLLKNKVQETKQGTIMAGELRIKTKIDGWYIVNLSNDEIYEEVLTKVQNTKKLVLEVAL